MQLEDVQISIIKLRVYISSSGFILYLKYYSEQNKLESNDGKQFL